jgi:DNA-binding IclR family transcriptional regulator
MCSFASPIFDYQGACVSAVGIVCFLQSGDRKSAVSEETLQALKNTAEAISTELGWHG